MTGNRSDMGYAKINFFYHPDHLGSTSMVTDAEGYITQNVSYIPYGEVFVEERNGVWNTPYLFNAKELDEETGMYYYGARYLNPKDTRWISVDPLFEKYVGMSPYNYCAGNPVRLVDPDGNGVYACENEDGSTSYAILSEEDTKEFGDTYKNEFGEYTKISDGFEPEGHVVKAKDNSQPVVQNSQQTEQKAPESVESQETTFKEKYVNAMYAADAWVNDKGRKLISGALLYNPIVGIPNDIKTIIEGEDIYGNKATGFDKCVSTLSVATFGAGKFLKLTNYLKRTNVDKVIVNTLDRVGLWTSGYSAIGVTHSDSNKK